MLLLLLQLLAGGTCSGRKRVLSWPCAENVCRLACAIERPPSRIIYIETKPIKAPINQVGNKAAVWREAKTRGNWHINKWSPNELNAIAGLRSSGGQNVRRRRGAGKNKLFGKFAKRT